MQLQFVDGCVFPYQNFIPKFGLVHRQFVPKRRSLNFLAKFLPSASAVFARKNAPLLKSSAATKFGPVHRQFVPRRHSFTEVFLKKLSSAAPVFDGGLLPCQNFSPHLAQFTASLFRDGAPLPQFFRQKIVQFLIEACSLTRTPSQNIAEFTASLFQDSEGAPLPKCFGKKLCSAVPVFAGGVSRIETSATKLARFTASPLWDDAPLPIFWGRNCAQCSSSF